MNKRVLFIARRALGVDVEQAATGVLRPVPFGSIALAIALLTTLAISANTRSLWALAATGAVVAIAGAVTLTGRSRRVLVAVRRGQVEVHRLRVGGKARGPIGRCLQHDLVVRERTRALILFLAPGGMVTIEDLEIALSHQID